MIAQPLIKPIETQYKGYRFRSRLEARWAVFFETLGIKWEYESEGYTLKDGTMYLPDFWFPDHQWHAEVKPSEIQITDADKHKMELFDSYPPHNGQGHLLSMGLIILTGMPELPELHDDERRGPDYWTGNTWFLLQCVGINFIEEYKRVISAVEAARSARFEHGERG